MQLLQKKLTNSCCCGHVCYLVYELLHPLHGVMSLQQRSHPHETLIAAPLVFSLLLFSSSSVVIFIFSSVLFTLWDTLKGNREQGQRQIRASVFMTSRQRINRFLKLC